MRVAFVSKLSVVVSCSEIVVLICFIRLQGEERASSVLPGLLAPTNLVGYRRWLLTEPAIRLTCKKSKVKKANLYSALL